MRRLIIVSVLVCLAGAGVAWAVTADTNASLWATLEQSSVYKRYARDNPNESARVKDYWLNGGSKPSAATKFGTFLVEVNEDRAAPPPPPPPPPPSGCALPAFPDASCTGVPAGTVLTPGGSITVSTAGTVINARDITGQIIVNAPNVTIRNSRIRGNAFRLIESNSTGLVVEDSEIINRPVAGQNNCHNGIGNGGYTVRRTEITGCENGADMNGGNVTFTDNYIHDLDTVGPSWVFGNSPHTDGIQFGQSGHDIVIRHNTVDPVGTVSGGGATSAIIMTTLGAMNFNVWVEDNYLDGRNSSIALYAPRQQTHDIYINRNRMLKGVYGQYTFCVKVGNTVTTFNGNTDATTGAAIGPDNGVGGGCTN